ncbi:MAG TPA: glucokinase [Allosphingosinicella sp.]|nr:glucokinase [Allosphingosinicella sp.]
MDEAAKRLARKAPCGRRLSRHLKHATRLRDFRRRFVAVGCFERRIGEIRVKLIMHPQLGLFGAAVAFAEE